MKKNLPLILIGSVLFIGVCVFLYPVVSALLAKMTQSTTIANYQRAVENLSNEEINTMKKEAQKYNESLYGSHTVDLYKDNKKSNKRYQKLLNIGNVMGYIEIPKIKVYLPIYHGSSKEVLEKGVGHLSNTSLPIGGRSTHSVLTGHSGLPSATLFTNIDQMKQGDLFYLHIFNDVLAYKVNQIKVVEPEDTKDLSIIQGEDYVTLITCTPYGINTHRLLIRGKRIPLITEENHIQTQIDFVSEVAIVPVGIVMSIVLPVVLLVRKKKRGRHA